MSALLRAVPLLAALALAGAAGAQEVRYQAKITDANRVGLTLTNYGFLGIAEMLHRLAARGCRIVEYPATLEARTTGTSKADVVPTALDHLRLLAKLLRLRLTGKLNLT